MGRIFQTLAVLSSFCFINVSCEVIVREVNSNEGSLCYLSDKQRGVCRTICVGTDKAEYESNVCSTEGKAPLYCCVDKARSTRYPEINKVCMNQRLDEEFFQRGQEAAQDLRKQLDDLRAEYNRHVDAVIKDCYQRSLDREEDEREDFLDKCLTIPQRSHLHVDSHPIEKLTKYPFVVGIGWKRAGDSVAWGCGGSLIHDSYVLTSASCISRSDRTPELVRLSSEELQISELEYEIQSVFIHDNYTKDSPYNDLAILKVQQLPLTDYRRYHYIDKRAIPVCIWTEQEPPSRFLSVSGYESLSLTNPDTGILFVRNATILPSNECTQKFRGDLPNGILGSQMCVKVLPPQNGLMCMGGAGGPLHFTETTWLNIPHLVGFASIGPTCMDNDMSVYTSVYPYLDWIEKVISGNH